MRAWLARHGEACAMDHFGLSRVSVARAAAGLPLQAATLRAILEGLDREVSA